MKTPLPLNKKSSTISRRKFLATAGGVTITITAYALSPRLNLGNKNPEKKAEASEITAWARIEPDGRMTIYNPAAEMGQGSMTALPVILAEELDADWSKVHIENSPIEPDVYGLDRWGGNKIMLTVGSWSVMGYFNSLRQAGAQARYVLLSSVAEHWNVPMSELTTEPGIVVHQKSGRRVSYGEITSFLKVPKSIPEIPEEQLKLPHQFRLIGSVIPRYDIPSKVDGSALFAMDVQIPDMLYGVIERGSVHGSSPTLQNEQAIRTMDGVVELVMLEYGVGIVATSLEKALNAKKRLKIQWSEDAKAQGHSSQEAFTLYQMMAEDIQQGEVLEEKGNFSQANSTAAKTYAANYKNDYVYHAQMEPLNAIASVAADGSSAEIWAGTQAAGSVADEVGKVLKFDPSKVTLHPHFLGGGLGRRSNHDSILEAVQLSKAVSKPVKLIWSREDDLRYGMYRPMSFQRLQASVDASGNLSGLSHCVVGDGGGLLTSGAKNEFYAIPNQHLELRAVENGIRLKHWRAVGHGPNKFAIESFMDEIAADQGVDPYEFRRKLMKDSPRALQTLEKAATMAKWNTPSDKGRARGIAFGERSGALCTGICEISLDREKGKIKVHHFWSAVDAGIIVQPDNVVAQMEGGIIMGISSVLEESITIEKGQVQQSNFNDYRLLRITDIPESIEIAMIPSEEPPQGIGEASLPVVAGAIANAFAALTGKRLRHLPFTPERVLEALNA
ncbi:xanthine dehydrogenase family protein molybdopterin-binding subunit [Catalinimonas niigatensis]|uniref:xanthine dehydrogenase family protein molybdopterin-binding subunit n=1 Tax=Catalinimonas niigatensis TaxID=1397264 RepID=UPI00266576B4|nr:molybdopterin cofactor-binding domain-containing protein [Catalinimonas niigatensis]WPP50785.1 molybdopterin cofactor-binding domain-containing protein [Catalinimonas niigatensis]